MPNTTVEELDTQISQLKQDIYKLDTEIESTTKELNEMGFLTCPFYLDGKKNMHMFSDGVLGTYEWESYINFAYDKWKNLGRKESLILPKIINTAYYISLITYVILMVFAVFYFKVHKALGIWAVELIFFTYMLFELAVLLFQTNEYVWKPNRLIKRDLKKKLKNLNIKRSTLGKDLTIKENLLEQYKLSQVNPIKKFSSVKSKRIDELAEILSTTETEIIPNISDNYKTEYTKIIQNCRNLLSIASEDSRPLTELTNIYTIYISEINNILMNSSAGGNAEEIDQLLKSFKSFIDRKTQKAKKMKDMELSIDISALTKAFTEDLE